MEKPAYKHGYIFGMDALLPYNEMRALATELRNARERDFNKRYPLWERFGKEQTRLHWNAWNTRLDKYFPSINFNFRKYLVQQLRKAKRENRKLRVLDVGVGTAKQYEKYLKIPALELHATSLTDSVPAELQSKINFVKCRADQLHKHFAPGYFDIVISSHGGHHQELALIENAMHVLKPSGELLLEADNDFLEVIKKPHFYEILTQGHAPGWGVHLRKK
jgi:SAM-dependent methyltransferase